MRRSPGVLSGVLCVVMGLGLSAQDWTGWRGPNRDGVTAFREPKAWPEKLTTKWKVPIGEGYASPLFAGGRILAFARQGDDEVAMSVDPENGKILWRADYGGAPKYTMFVPVDVLLAQLKARTGGKL